MERRASSLWVLVDGVSTRHSDNRVEGVADQQIDAIRDCSGVGLLLHDVTGEAMAWARVPRTPHEAAVRESWGILVDWHP